MDHPYRRIYHCLCWLSHNPDEPTQGEKRLSVAFLGEPVAWSVQYLQGVAHFLDKKICQNRPLFQGVLSPIPS